MDGLAAWLDLCPFVVQPSLDSTEGINESINAHSRIKPNTDKEKGEEGLLRSSLRERIALTIQRPKQGTEEQVDVWSLTTRKRGALVSQEGRSYRRSTDCHLFFSVASVCSSGALSRHLTHRLPH